MFQLKPEMLAPELQPPPQHPLSPSQSDQNLCVDSQVKDADGTKEV